MLQVTESLRVLEGGSGGWEFLFSSSKNFSAAKLLALQSSACEPERQFRPVPADLRAVVRRTLRAYLESQPSLRSLEHPAYLHTAGEGSLEFQVSEDTECGYWGNDHLAFVTTVSTYESPRAVGRKSVLLVMLKDQSQWRLLTASTDPTSNGNFVNTLKQLHDSMIPGKDAVSKLAPAEIVAPEDGQAPHPSTGQRFGDFVWRPSPSREIIAEIAEFAYQGDSRLFLNMRQGSPSSQERVSEGSLWSTRTVWKWRIWSISSDGSIVFSDPRAFPH